MYHTFSSHKSKLLSGSARSWMRSPELHAAGLKRASRHSHIADKSSAGDVAQISCARCAIYTTQLSAAILMRIKLERARLRHGCATARIAAYEVRNAACYRVTTRYVSDNLLPVSSRRCEAPPPPIHSAFRTACLATFQVRPCESSTIKSRFAMGPCPLCK